MEMAFGPLARWTVVAEEEHGNGGGSDEDERDDESYTPGDMGGKVLGIDERVEDGWHNEVSDSTS